MFGRFLVPGASGSDLAGTAGPQKTGVGGDSPPQGGLGGRQPPNLYDEPGVWGGAGCARMADYAADKAVKLATREVPWAGLRGALAALP